MGCPGLLGRARPWVGSLPQETMAAPGGHPGSGWCASRTSGAPGSRQGLGWEGERQRGSSPAWPARWRLRWLREVQLVPGEGHRRAETWSTSPQNFSPSRFKRDRETNRSSPRSPTGRCNSSTTFTVYSWRNLPRGYVTRRSTRPGRRHRVQLLRPAPRSAPSTSAPAGPLVLTATQDRRYGRLPASRPRQLL
jgi:hypothetical protein